MLQTTKKTKEANWRKAGNRGQWHSRLPDKQTISKQRPVPLPALSLPHLMQTLSVSHNSARLLNMIIIFENYCIFLAKCNSNADYFTRLCQSLSDQADDYGEILCRSRETPLWTLHVVFNHIYIPIVCYSINSYFIIGICIRRCRGFGGKWPRRWEWGKASSNRSTVYSIWKPSIFACFLRARREIEKSFVSSRWTYIQMLVYFSFRSMTRAALVETSQIMRRILVTR